jgi:hypothetical protein
MGKTGKVDCDWTSKTSQSKLGMTLLTQESR